MSFRGARNTRYTAPLHLARQVAALQMILLKWQSKAEQDAKGYRRFKCYRQLQVPLAGGCWLKRWVKRSTPVPWSKGQSGTTQSTPKSAVPVPWSRGQSASTEPTSKIAMKANLRSTTHSLPEWIPQRLHCICFSPWRREYRRESL